ncbi:MAG TPA: radical SAM family heme chaperone HemW [Syntrophorhabdaceae bacterium]|jgi:oxygen-independent coproporphyrinogen-3 oxidase
MNDPPDRAASADTAPIPGLYIHVPFCATKCPYCDFYSVTDSGGIRRWLDSLGREMEHYAPLFHSFDSVYVGGGTPSLLDGPSFSRLFSLIRRFCNIAEDTEITVELNPDDVTEERLVYYRSAGVNRLSLGIQSFSDEDLLFLRRRHDSRRAIDALKAVGRLGFDNFAIDLIYGIKGQTKERWRKTLDQAIAFGPAHLSCYQLTLEGDTPFGKLAGKGILKPLPESTERRFFLDTSRFLEKQGFIHYEISNFARSQELISRHNSKYWNHTPYLGLGPGAHSFLNGKRWWNFRSLDKYCAHLAQGTLPVEDSEILTIGQTRLERLYFGFRTRGGLPVADLLTDERTSKLLHGLKNSGFLKIRNEQVFLTRKGFLVADRLPLLFDIEQLSPEQISRS